MQIKPAPDLLYRGITIASLTFAAFLFSPPALTQEAVDSVEATESAPGNVIENNKGEIVEETRVDRLYERTTRLIQGTTGYFDNFFFADTTDTYTSNETKVRLRLNGDYIEGHGWDFHPNVRLNLALPFLNDKMRLVMNEDSDDDQGSAAADSSEGSDLALRWVELDSDRLGLSFDIGIRLASTGYPEQETELSVFGRINTSLRLQLGEHWESRSNNRLYYYSNTGIRNDFREYLDREITENVMFRSRTRIQYFEENGYNPEW